MEKTETNFGVFVQRHLSQMKVLARLVEHELGAAKGAKDVTIERDLVENILDALEIFIEDFDRSNGDARTSKPVDAKPAVTRLN
jgi:hypothetical protein